MEAPKVVRAAVRRVLATKVKAVIAVTDHISGNRCVVGYGAYRLRQCDADRLIFAGIDGYLFFVVIRIRHKRICPRIGVGAKFGNVNAVHIAPSRVAFGNMFGSKVIDSIGHNGRLFRNFAVFGDRRADHLDGRAAGLA